MVKAGPFHPGYLHLSSASHLWPPLQLPDWTLTFAEEIALQRKQGLLWLVERVKIQVGKVNGTKGTQQGGAMVSMAPLGPQFWDSQLVLLG